MKFRLDINALRAIAVIAVVLYHFDIPPFHGGFIGVDVFFVISGFLMTGLIVDPRAGHFSLIGFYIARAIRIVPALGVLCLVLVVLGWLFMTPVDYVSLAAQVGASLGFVSNITSWWREGDYFFAVSQSNFLLHTWSLSLEWQFYLIYPLYVIVLRRAFSTRRAIGCGIAVAFVLSFAANVVLANNSPMAAFYLLPARAWEMLLGGLVYFAPAVAGAVLLRRIVAGVGWLSIAAAAVFYTTNTPWPSFFALVPTVGAAAVILARVSGDAITENRVVQYLGRASYSIYLWHWPVVVALRYVDAQFDAVDITAGVGASLLLGAVSYRLIEGPSIAWLRARNRAPEQAFGALAPIPLVGALSAAVIVLGGFPQRVPPAVNAMLRAEFDIRADDGACDVTRPCTIGEGPVRAIVWGDSVASAVVTAAAEAARIKDGSVRLFTHGACPIVFDVQIKRFWPERECAEFVAATWNAIRALPLDIPVIIVNRTPIYVEGFNERQGGALATFDGEPADGPEQKKAFVRHAVASICEMTAERRVFYVKPLPEMGVNVPRTQARRIMLRGAGQTVSISRADYDRRNVAVAEFLAEASSKCGARVLDPLPYLCDQSRCLGSDHGQAFYRDDNHPTETGNKKLVPMFRQVFDTQPEGGQGYSG